MTQSEALMQISALESEINVMGANDSEMHDLSIIKEGIASGQVAPEAGVRQAEGLRASKQDYH